MLSIAHDRGLKRLAVIGGDIAFAHSLANAVPVIARGFGQAVVYQEFYPATPAIFRRSSRKCARPTPTSCWPCRFPNDSVGVLRQLKVANYAPKMFYEAIGASDPQFPKNVGSDAEGTYSSVSWNIAAKDAANLAFMKSYADEYHRAPDYHAAANFACIHVVAAALKKIGRVDQEQLRDAYASMQIPTILGTYKVDPRTGIQLGYLSYIIQWQHGKQIVVYPSNVADGKPVIPFPAVNSRS